MKCWYQINGVVQHYTWGGSHFIPQLFHLPEGEKPCAEYWLGAHPNHPSPLTHASTDLAQLIHDHPRETLGAALHFRSLPFLLKVLDVKKMLSIQVHPSKAEAEKGFADEEARGIPLQAPHRNYKDRNHKPELMVALGDFWLLHGFKPADQLVACLNAAPELQFLVPWFEDYGYKGMYERVMKMESAEVNRILQPLIDRILPLYEKGELDKSGENFWAARAALSFNQPGQADRGLFSVYFFNLLHLKKGEGIFQPQGIPHAYLEGQNVELMANSDNVLRGGLTDKHVDVPELLRHIAFEATRPHVIDFLRGEHQCYDTPAEEFELHRYQLEQGEREITVTTAEIWLVMEGEGVMAKGQESQELHAGESWFMVPGHSISLSTSGRLNLYRARVPV